MEYITEKSIELISSLCDIKSTDGRLKTIQKYLVDISNQRFCVVNDFVKDLEWFNVKEGLSFQNELRGKIVVLDFFTYCCINCMHILPDLEELEAKFKDTDGVVVVGVHSAKFENEKVSENILSAILRYNIKHPVVNDSEAVMWNDLGINCWPTQLVLGPNNEVLVSMVGEGHRQNMLDFVSQAVSFYSERGQLDKHKIDIDLSRDRLPPSPVLFPGKVSTSHTGQYLAVSDTGHHRILVLDDTGLVRHTIGCGEVGFSDGRFRDTRFRAPQGLCWSKDDQMIYVADTENHAIRQIDLVRACVSTLAGTGKQGTDLEGGKLGKEQPISSPWDLVLGRISDSPEDNVLFIAMAGTHQIWMYFLASGKGLLGESYAAGACVRFAGNGNEENRNNNYPHKASFAQPSGIALAAFRVKAPFGKKPQASDSPPPAVPHLVVADSESSSVRGVTLRDGAVKAVVGAARDPSNLFAFGDVDGKGYDVKLQHPLGVASVPNEPSAVYVADSYNHKVKRIDLNSKECVTVIGSGKPGDYTGNDSVSHPALNEPGGLCLHPDCRRLYIADTNNHCIKVFDVQQGTLTKLTVRERKDVIDGAPIPTKAKPKSIVNKRATRKRESGLSVSAGTRLVLRVTVDMAEGLHFTEGAPSACQLLVQDPASGEPVVGDITPHHKQGLEDSNRTAAFTLRIPRNTTTNELDLVLECAVYYCDVSGVCLNKGFVFEIPVAIAALRHNRHQQPANDIEGSQAPHYEFNGHQLAEASCNKKQSFAQLTQEEGKCANKTEDLVQYDLTLTLPKT